MILENRGRPKKRQGMETGQILIATTPEIKTWIREQADKEGRSMSYYVHRLIQRDIEEQSKKGEL